MDLGMSGLLTVMLYTDFFCYTGEAHLIHLSCGSRNVWAIDSDGVVYQRIGVKAPSTHSLQAAWLPVDSGPSGTTFIQVFTGPSDLYVCNLVFYNCTIW